MSATLTTFDAMLKEFYIDKVPEAVNQKITLKDHFAKRTDSKVDGRRVIYPIHVGRNTGVGAIAEGGNLPTAGNQQYVDMIVPFRYNYGRIQLTAQAMKQSMTSKSAFRKAVDEEIKRAAKDVGREINRQMFGFGRGDLCHVDGAQSSTTLNVKNPGGVVGAVNAARFLRKGDVIALVTSAGVFNAAVTVVSVAANLSSIVVTPTVAANDNDRIVRCSTAASTSLNDTGYANEVMGLLGHIDDATYASTYHGISRSSYPIMNSYVLDANGDLKLETIQQAFDGADQLGNGVIKVLFGHHTARAEYLGLLQTFRRYVDAAAKSPDGGFKGAALASDIEYSEKPWKVDRDAPYGMIFGIDDSNMFRYVVSEAEWAEEDGRILMRVAGVDAYEARFRIFDNYACDTPNSSFVIRNVTTKAPAAIQAI